MLEKIQLFIEYLSSPAKFSNFDYLLILFILSALLWKQIMCYDDLIIYGTFDLESDEKEW